MKICPILSLVVTGFTLKLAHTAYTLISKSNVQAVLKISGGGFGFLVFGKSPPYFIFL